MLKKLFKKKKPLDIKTITFYKFAYNIGASEEKHIENIKVETLLLDSFLFLMKERVVTKQQENNILIFKDQYNLYLDYCVDSKLVKKDMFLKVKSLNTLSVPDMSKIQVPDMSKELKEMELDIENIGKVFSGLKN
ncbi:MAG: hypothetical protein U9Q33_05770 [Campylobacterota bacterium]|nr:hypothetical protein [Campylobacterota bacterium]